MYFAFIDEVQVVPWRKVVFEIVGMWQFLEPFTPFGWLVTQA